MRAMHPGARPGINLLEVVLAASMAGMVMLGLGSFITGTLKSNRTEGDYSYAMQKAIQMMEEVGANRSDDPSDPGPDKFADGPHFELSTVKDVSPHGALSGNPKVNGYYKYVRQITSESVSGDPKARLVTVKIWYNKKSATPTIDSGKPLVTLTNLFRSNVGAVDPKNVIDVYILSIENLPHVNLDGDVQHLPNPTAARAAFGAALADVEAKNPYLSFRKHFITRLSTGRDVRYRPYINAAKGAGGYGTRDPFNWIYFYPGAAGDASNVDKPKYYDKDAINGAHLEGNASSDDKTKDSNYALADQFNHPVRYPQEFGVTSAGSPFGAPTIPTGGTPSNADYMDLSLRQFLEDLLADDTGKYRNAMLVNLHGDLFPALALRNYADPAKDPTGSNGAEKRRVVTHPYRLVTPATGTPVRLAVHGFLEDGSNQPNSISSSNQHVTNNWLHNHLDPGDTEWPYVGQFRITIKNIQNYIAHDTLLHGVTHAGGASGYINDIRVTAIQKSRTNNGNDNTQYRASPQWPTRSCAGFAHSGPHAVNHELTGSAGEDHHGGCDGHSSTPSNHTTDPAFSGTDAVIYVSDMDYDAHYTDDGGTEYGLYTSSSDYLLHRLQYFPDPWLPFLNDSNGSAHYPRNTARLLIEFYPNASAAGKVFEVETALKLANGTFATGTNPGVSRTWFYVDTTTGTWSATKKLYWSGGKPSIPWTDQVQLVGDPRHNPYLDARAGGLVNPYFSKFGLDDNMYSKDIVSNKSGDSAENMDAFNSWAGLSGPPTATLTPLTYNVSVAGSADGWNGMKYNAPAYLRMWREAILRNSMVFVNPTGTPFRFLGQGGEFGLEKKIDDVDFKLVKKPYDGTSASTDAGALSDELTGGGNATYAVRGDTNLWYAKPWIGELYPAGAWSDWNGKGNLPVGTTATTFKRLAAPTKWSYGTNIAANDKEAGTGGFASFLNSVKSGGGTTAAKFLTDSDKAVLEKTGAAVADALAESLKASVPTKNAYRLDSGANTPEWSDSAISAERTTVNWLNSTKTPIPYYKGKNSGEYPLAPITMTEGTRRATVVANVMDADNAGSLNEIYRISATAMTAAYLDGAQQAHGASNIKILPRVKLTAPKKGASLSKANSPITITWYTKWVKPDGKPYSPLYSETQSDPLTASSGEPYDVKHYVTFKAEPSGSWIAAGLVSPARTALIAGSTPGYPVAGWAGIPNSSYQASPYIGKNDVTWDISGLTPGDYRLRISAFRDFGSGAVEGNHSYHDIPITISN